jgi:hypothetical protein
MLCYLYGHPIMDVELHEVSKVYIVDAIHLKAHLVNKVRSDINKALKWLVLFNISHLRAN